MDGDDTATTTGSNQGSGSRQLSLLLVDPDAAVRESVATAARETRTAFEVIAVRDIAGALTAVEGAAVDCVATEFELPDGTAGDLRTRLAEVKVNAPTVVFTNEDPGAVSGASFRAGAADFVQKRPDGPVEFLLDKVEGAIERSQAGRVGDERRGVPPTPPQLVTLLDGSGDIAWQWGALPDGRGGDPIDDVAGALAEGERFREVVERGAADGESDEWIWPREAAGAIEHRSVPLPAMADLASLSLFRDVSEERQVRQEHETFAQLLDTARDGLYTLDQNGYYRYVNRSMATQLGYEPTELVGTHASGILTGDSYAEGQAKVQALVEDEERESEVLELSVQRKTGEELPVAIHFAPLYGEDGSYDGLVGVMRDITARKEREERLEESERRYRTLAENLPNGAVAMFDDALTYTLVEGELFESLDYEIADFEGTPIATVHAEAYVERHLDRYETVFAGERAEFEFTHSERIFRTHLVPLRDEAGAISAGLALILEVTERREHERELERQNRRLNEFASIVSHDLRNPLNVIGGNLELYRETGDEARLDRVEENVERMETLIEELLQLARGGRAVGERESVDLDALVEQCWSGIDTRAARLERQAPLGSIQADETRLIQLFENLFRNAVEHGGEDVTVTVGPLPRGFSVADTGEGLPPDLGPEIFEYGVTRGEDGTGIGLAIVEEVASAHGWTVTAGESAAGGARFEIRATDYPTAADES